MIRNIASIIIIIGVIMLLPIEIWIGFFFISVLLQVIKQMCEIFVRLLCFIGMPVSSYFQRRWNKESEKYWDNHKDE